MFAEKEKGFPGRMASILAGLMISALGCLNGCAVDQYGSSYAEQGDIDDVEYLSYYGEWIYAPPYGTVWRPDVTLGWEPFYYGNWAWTSEGWAWNSYEPYGWLVFHYGSWGYEPGIGWFWIPGDVWYPAAVEWYTFGDYAAWAPMPPSGAVWPDPWDPYDVDVWVVIYTEDFTREDVGRYRVRMPVTRESVDFRTAVKRAPDVREIEDRTKKKLPAAEVRQEPANVRTRAISLQPGYGGEEEKDQPAAGKVEERLKKMVLPLIEKRKVERNASRIEKEVLIRREKDAAPAKKSSGQERDTSGEKK